MKKKLLISGLVLALVAGFMGVAKADADTTAPTVAITSPIANMALTGAATLSATAADNVGVIKVEFFDGTTSIGVSTSTAAPYTLSWDTTKVPNGVHVLTADASDAAGNKTTSASVGVVVWNAGQNNNNGNTAKNTKMTINITPSGEALLRGLVTANSNGVLTVQVWGITFAVKTTGAEFVGVANAAAINVGDYVGIHGTVDTTASTSTINADVVRVRTPFTGHRDNESEKNKGHEHGQGNNGQGQGNGKGHENGDR